MHRLPGAPTRDAILLTWNPERWPWDEISVDAARAVAGLWDDEDYWSVGNRRQLADGTRFFLIRLGREPRGIVASGWTRGEVFELPHYDEELRAQGRRARRVRVRFDRILDPRIHSPFPRAELDRPPFDTVHWSTQSSGITIPGPVAVHLQLRWERHCGGLMPRHPPC